MANMKIDGTGTSQHSMSKKNKSYRAIKGDLTVVKRRCEYCGHHKGFEGNVAGLNINKCTRCKKKIKNKKEVT